MKKLSITLGMLLLATISFSQENTEILTSIKPADERPATFRSAEHLNEKKDSKIIGIKEQILANKDNPEKVEALRIQLWRFENAIIVEPKQN